jgi:hypothetical protein
MNNMLWLIALLLAWPFGYSLGWGITRILRDFNYGGKDNG